MVDIILVTCNRLHFLKQSLESLYERISTPFNLIVVDNNSKDGTVDYLKEKEEIEGKFKVILKDVSEWCSVSNQQGFDVGEAKWVITMQDDVVVPKLNPCVVQQLIDLMEEFSEYGAISCRIQRVPNVDFTVSGKVVPIRKSLASYFRIHRRSDIVMCGGFGDRRWEATGINQQLATIGKKCGWAKDLWCNHLGYCENRGFPDWYIKENAWPYKDKRQQDYIKRPYPKIDPLTNVPIE